MTLLLTFLAGFAFASALMTLGIYLEVETATSGRIARYEN